MVPEPARFALRALVVSMLREPSRAIQADKDRRQAAALIDALTERFPEWLTSAIQQLEGDARPQLSVAAARTIELVPSLTDRARDFLSELVA